MTVFVRAIEDGQFSLFGYLIHHSSSIDIDRLSGHEAGIGGGQEEGRIGDLLRIWKPPQQGGVPCGGDPLFIGYPQHAVQLIADLVMHFRSQDNARAERIHADALGA